jgi:hypothetical protein
MASNKISAEAMAAVMSDLPPPTPEEISSLKEYLAANQARMSWTYANRGKAVPQSLVNTEANYIKKALPFHAIHEQRIQRLREAIPFINAEYSKIVDFDNDHALNYYYDSIYMGGGKRNTDKSRRKTRRRKY